MFSNGLLSRWLRFLVFLYLAVFTEEIKQEFKPYFVDSNPLIDMNSTKLGRLNVDGRDYVQTGLAVSILCIYMIWRG